MPNKYNDHIIEDLLRLRNEIAKAVFSSDITNTSTSNIEIVLKINSVLYRGYPRRQAKEINEN